MTISNSEAQELHGRIGAALENFKHMPKGYTAADAGKELAPILERALELAAIIVSDTMEVGVEAPTPTEDEARRRYIRGELDKVVPGGGQVKLKLLNEEGESFWLNITSDQQAAIEKVLLPEPESPVSYSPCLQGKVLIDGAESEFMIPLANDSVGFSQWGAPNEVLWQRVELLDNLSGPAREWWADNQPEEDEDA